MSHSHSLRRRRQERRGRPVTVGPRPRRLRLERLEERLLLSGTRERLAESIAWPDVSEEAKSSISVKLLELIDGRPMPANGLVPVNDRGQVGVRVTAKDVDHLEPLLVGLGFETTATRPDLHFLEGRLPLTSILDTATLKTEGLLGVRPLSGAGRGAGLVTSIGDAIHQAARVRGALPDSFDYSKHGGYPCVQLLRHVRH